jgi:hypothetical protein
MTVVAGREMQPNWSSCQSSKYVPNAGMMFESFRMTHYNCLGTSGNMSLYAMSAKFKENLLRICEVSYGNTLVVSHMYLVQS